MARLTYDAVLHRFHDLVTGELWDEARLHAKAGELRVHGAGTRGAGGLTMRLMRTAGAGGRHGHARPGGRPGRSGGMSRARTSTGGRCSCSTPGCRRAALAGDVAGADAGVWVEHVERLIPDAPIRERVLDRLAWAVSTPA